MDVDIGRVIAGKYQLSRLLGRGAMGEVWLATHKTLGGDFAVKVVSPTMDLEREVATKRFTFEAQISAKLSRMTRHIVSVVDHGEEDGIAYLVMEKLEGESLEALIDRQGALELPYVVGVVAQIARALTVAHREGVIHRDLKPANVFLTRDEDGKLLVKLLDFGIARPNQGERSPFATAKDMVLGTPAYMSPEQARASASIDLRCDVWALAVLAYEALTAQIPWEGETAEEVFVSVCVQRWTRLADRRPDLPREVGAIFDRQFVDAIDARYGSAAELAAALESLVSPAEVEAAVAPGASMRRIALLRPVTTDPIVHRTESIPLVTKKRSGIALASIAGAVLALAVLGGAVAVLHRASPPPVAEIAASPLVASPAVTMPSATAPSAPVLAPLDPPAVPSAVASAPKAAVTASPPTKRAGAKSADPPAVTAAAPAPSPPAPSPDPPPVRDKPPQRKTDKGEIF